MLETVWFTIWATAWAVYFALDGFDLGIGTMLPFAARGDAERKLAINAMGPFWDGNEVWLVTAGGVTFAAFPAAYATLFSALYLPFMLLLLALILRGVAFEFRSKVSSLRWRHLWDGSLSAGSLLTAMLLGITFGNLCTGIPVDPNGILHGGPLSLLTPLPLLGGLFFTLVFAQHGLLWLAFKTEGELQNRAHRLALRLWWAADLAAIVFWYEASLYMPRYASSAVYAVLAFLFIFLMERLLLVRRQFLAAWALSALFIITATLWMLFGIFPDIVRSSISRAASVTVWNGGASPHSLTVMLIATGIFLPIVIAYQSWVYVRFRASVTPDSVKNGPSY